MTLLFKPILAYSKTPNLEDIVYPCIASPKLDGIRCIMADGVAFTRSMKRVPNKFIQQELAKLRLHGPDGELMVKGGFNNVQSAVMSVHGEPDFYLNVFDDFWHVGGFVERLAIAAKVVEQHKGRLKLVEHVVCNNAKELQALWDKWVAEGHEGAMVRAPNGPYKRGRSTLKQGYLIKLKKWHDNEAVIIGFKEGEINTNEAYTGELGQTKRSTEKAGMVPSGTLGALCVDYYGKNFDIGTGFGGGVPGEDARVRAEIWSKQKEFLGKKVTFKFQELSSYGIPRFPVFLHFRDDE